jgi:voltage-gated sodium channel
MYRSPALYKAQTALKSLVQDWRYQFVVVTAIVTNFLCNIVEATMNPVPEGSQAEKNFVVIDLFFIVFFTVELVMNIGAHWFFEFWEDRANWLDTGVVLISLVGLTMQGGGAFTVIRIMRVLRVVRVFKRIASVRLIVTALGAAVVPVSNAFFIMILATTIWAILGVNLFDKRSPEFFGNFGAAFFTVPAFFV